MIAKAAPWASMLLGLALLAVSAMLMGEGLASYGWAETQGTIVDHRVVSEYQHGAGKQTRYHAEVRYRYSVNGTPFSGNRHAIGRGPNATGGFKSAEDARAAVSEAFPKGASAIIYFDPDRPAEAVLRRGADWTSGIPALIGLLFLAGGVWLVRQPSGVTRE